MKQIKCLVMILCSMMMLMSCSKDGNCPPIVVDKDEVIFDSAGGKDVVTIVRNYEGWLVNSIKDIDTGKNYFDVNPDNARSIKGNGIVAIVDGKALTIIVDPSSENHRWSISMGHLNAFKSIRVEQRQGK